MDAARPGTGIAVLRSALFILAVHTVLMPVLHTLNLLHFPDLWVKYQYASFVFLPIAFAGALLVAKKPNLAKFDAFELFMLFLGFWALIMTVRFGGGPIDILGKVLRFVLVFCAYKCGRQILDEETAAKYLRILAKTSFVGVLGAVLIIYGAAMVLHLPLVVSIVGEYIVVSIAYLLIKKPRNHYLYIALCLAVLFLSGKRGNYMAGAAEMILYVILMVRTGRLSLSVLRKPVAALSASLAVVILGMTSVNATQYLDWLPKGIRSRVEVFTGEKSATEVTAGRNLEVVIALRELGYQPFGVVTGLGLGASMPGVVGRTADTIHIQPLFMTFMLGFVGLALYVWACVASVRPIYRPEVPWTDSDLILCLFAVGLMVTTLTSATFLQTPLLWLALGYLQRRASSLSEETVEVFRVQH